MQRATNHNHNLSYIRNCSPTEIIRLVSTSIPQDRLPIEYLKSLSEEDRTICLRACMMCWAVTGFMVPREMQLRVVLGDVQGHDVLISAGTGSGKTLPMALSILLDNPDANFISITISPLKRLQVTQEVDFNSRFGIPTITINEDTPRDDDWWNANVYDSGKRIPGTFRHLIVTVEQLFKSSAGHFARLGILVRKTDFNRRIVRINVDEAHFIHTAGLPLYGLNAFRPAWGQLDQLKALLPSHIRWKAFSATFPPHILKTVTTTALKPNHITIRITSNRPNTMYASHQVHGSIDDPRNYECFIQNPFNFDQQPHVLLFFDDKDLTSKVSQHLDSKLPIPYRGRGVVKHYHSLMSEGYLQRVHDLFVQKDGMCRILVTTSGQSVGVDFPNVKIVCTAGLPSTIVDALQRGGRVFRVSNDTALFVVFYEAWALDIQETDYTGDVSNPDRPRKDLKPTSRRPERAPLSAVQLVQSKGCKRHCYATYLNDKTPEAMLFITPFCCDGHNDGFQLEGFLPGYLYSGAITITIPEAKSANRYRPTWERHALDIILINWAENEHCQDEYFRAPYDIISRDQLHTLIWTKIEDITSPASITELLEETPEWGEEWAAKLYKVICGYQLIRPPKPPRKK